MPKRARQPMNALQESLDNLMATREQAQREFDAAQTKIQKLDQALAVLSNLVVDVDPVYLRKRQDFAGLGILQATRRWLQEIGTGARTEVIAEEILSRGVETASKRFVATVYASLKNSPDFVRRGKKWFLKETPEGK